MPTPTYTPIASTTLSSNQASVTFSSIVGTYRDLILVIQGSLATTPGDLTIRFNGDTGSNYSYVRMSGSGTATDSSAATSAWAFISGFQRASTNWVCINQIMDYTQSKHKTMLTRFDDSSRGTNAIATRWANTNAITSIVIAELSGYSFTSGTTFNLFGVIA